MWKTGASHWAVLITDTLISLLLLWDTGGNTLFLSTSLLYISCHAHESWERKEKQDEKEGGGNNFFAVQQILFKMARLPDAPQLQQLADGKDCRWMGTAETQIQLRVAGSTVFAVPPASHSYSTSREWVAKQGEDFPNSWQRKKPSVSITVFLITLSAWYYKAFFLFINEKRYTLPSIN